MHPPPSGRHAMRSLYVIGRDGWVWDMSNTQWLEMDSSHGVGECSVTAVCPLAGKNSDRLPHKIIVVIVTMLLYRLVALPHVLACLLISSFLVIKLLVLFSLKI